MLILLLFCMLTSELLGADKKPDTFTSQNTTPTRDDVVASLNKLTSDSVIKIANETVALPIGGVVLDESGMIACGPNSDGTRLYLFNYSNRSIIAQKPIVSCKNLMVIATTKDRRTGIVTKGLNKTIEIVGYKASGEHFFFSDHDLMPDSNLFFSPSQKIVYAFPHPLTNEIVDPDPPSLTLIINQPVAQTDKNNTQLAWHLCYPNNLYFSPLKKTICAFPNTHIDPIKTSQRLFIVIDQTDPSDIPLLTITPDGSATDNHDRQVAWHSIYPSE